MQTEQEIFDRCLTSLPPVHEADRPQVPLAELEAEVAKIKASDSPQDITRITHRLIEAAESGAQGAEQAAKLLKATLSDLTERAIRTGLGPSLKSGAETENVIDHMIGIADELERLGQAQALPTVRWLRGRIIELIDQSMLLAPDRHEVIVAFLADNSSEDFLLDHAKGRLDSAVRRLTLRAQLIDQGATLPHAEEAEARRLTLLTRLETELVMVWDEIFRTASKTTMTRLAEVLKNLRPTITRLDDVQKQLETLGYSSQFKPRVVRPRVEPIVKAGFEQMQVSSRNDVIGQVKHVLNELAEADLKEAVTVSSLVTWVAQALCRTDHDRPSPKENIRHLADYNAEADTEDDRSVLDALLDVAVLVGPKKQHHPQAPEEVTHDLFEILRALPTAVKAEVIKTDLARTERTLARLESWWTYLASDKEQDPIRTLEHIVQSSFLRIMRTESAPLLALREARQLAEAFPEQSRHIKPIFARIERLDHQSTQVMVELLEARGQRAWDKTLNPTS